MSGVSKSYLQHFLQKQQKQESKSDEEYDSDEENEQEFEQFIPFLSHKNYYLEPVEVVNPFHKTSKWYVNRQESDLIRMMEIFISKYICNYKQQSLREEDFLGAYWTIHKLAFWSNLSPEEPILQKPSQDKKNEESENPFPVLLLQKINGLLEFFILFIGDFVLTQFQKQQQQHHIQSIFNEEESEVLEREQKVIICLNILRNLSFTSENQYVLAHGENRRLVELLLFILQFRGEEYLEMKCKTMEILANISLHIHIQCTRQERAQEQQKKMMEEEEMMEDEESSVKREDILPLTIDELLVHLLQQYICLQPSKSNGSLYIANRKMSLFALECLHGIVEMNRSLFHQHDLTFFAKFVEQNIQLSTVEQLAEYLIKSIRVSKKQQVELWEEKKYEIDLTARAFSLNLIYSLCKLKTTKNYYHSIAQLVAPKLITLLYEKYRVKQRLNADWKSSSSNVMNSIFADDSLEAKDNDEYIFANLIIRGDSSQIQRQQQLLKQQQRLLENLGDTTASSLSLSNQHQHTTLFKEYCVRLLLQFSHIPLQESNSDQPQSMLKPFEDDLMKITVMSSCLGNEKLIEQLLSGICSLIK